MNNRYVSTYRNTYLCPRLSCFIPFSTSGVKPGWEDWVGLTQDLLMRTELYEGSSVENLALVEFWLSTRWLARQDG